VLIVENQLATTDHSHLGQVLTYAAGTAASTIVWIATAFREEHRQALDWLNESTGEDVHFFGIELQVVHIGESPPAPLLNVVVQPNDWQKSVRAATSQAAITGKGAIYVKFWAAFLERVNALHPDWTRARRTSAENLLGMKSPLRGSQIVASFAQGDRLCHYLYIDVGEAEATTALYEFLYEHREVFETAYGRSLEWEGSLGGRAHGVSDCRDNCNAADESRHTDYIEWFIDAGVRMRRALAAVGPPPA
jgi:hypothetical protein